MVLVFFLILHSKRLLTNLFVALKRHVKHVHGDQEPTRLKRVCDECGAMFLTLNGFENHKQLHKGENPYKCTFDDCEKLFADATGKIQFINPTSFTVHMLFVAIPKISFPLPSTRQHNVPQQYSTMNFSTAVKSINDLRL